MITKAMLEKKVKRINEIMERPTTPYTKTENGSIITNHGCVVLDYNPIYGGSMLMQMEEQGGQSNFGPIPYRLKNKDMNVYLDGIIFGLLSR